MVFAVAGQGGLVTLLLGWGIGTFPLRSTLLTGPVLRATCWPIVGGDGRNRTAVLLRCRAISVGLVQAHLSDLGYHAKR